MTLYALYSKTPLPNSVKALFDQGSIELPDEHLVFFSSHKPYERIRDTIEQHKESCGPLLLTPLQPGYLFCGDSDAEDFLDSKDD